MNTERGNGFGILTGLVLLIVGLGLGYVAGSYYGSGRPATSTTATTTVTTINPPPSGMPPYYQNIAEWQTDTETAAGFSVAYPLDFPVTTGGASASTDWSLNANGTKGMLVFTLTVPKAFEPQTNFDDAKFTVGVSGNATAVTNCTKAGQNEVAVHPVAINGVAFTAFTSNDAGAGNLYDSTSYRAVHGGKCYAVEYTLHSSQLANYPSEYGLTQFDKAKLTDVLDRIAGTLKFQ